MPKILNNLRADSAKFASSGSSFILSPELNTVQTYKVLKLTDVPATETSSLIPIQTYKVLNANELSQQLFYYTSRTFKQKEVKCYTLTALSNKPVRERARPKKGL